MMIFYLNLTQHNNLTKYNTPQKLYKNEATITAKAAETIAKVAALGFDTSLILSLIDVAPGEVRYKTSGIDESA